MLVIIPLGGIGNRFKELKYNVPKALIKIFGKPIIYYLLESLNLNNIQYVYIPYNKEYANYNFESTLIKDFPNINFKFYKLTENTRGAAETINLSIQNLNIKNDIPVICLDGDNFYLCDIISLWNGKNSVITIEDNTNKEIYSYIKVEDNRIIDIVEKNKISDNACTGAYGFTSIKQLKEYSQYIIEHNMLQKSEFYISGIIKEMIKSNINFSNILIDKKEWVCLGTPIQLRMFYNNYPKISCMNSFVKIKEKRICFDLDNTLVTYPLIKGDYTTVKPIEKNINFLKYLKKFGNTIIIYTARRMKTHNGNIGKINSDIGKITFDTLDKFNIPYDEIYFGKPYADVYIDDLALNCFNDMEKELGYYIDNIEPRTFNNIEHNIIETITKKSNDLSGEIYYYRNIPIEIKDLFPSLIDYDENNKWYCMEKINGISCSSLYLSELLTTETLMHICKSIQRIQSLCTHNEINIYGNYAKKLKYRYNNYDYSQFHGSNSVFNNIYDDILNYEKHNLGKISLLHGDPVMTNIIINNYGKIKFIDMRGKIGNILTIEGDWLYDWAKLYQSLIGYDSILQSKEVSSDYFNNMIIFFTNYFISNYSEKDFNNLKTITKSLLFSLIPLHNNEKCIKYYDLIFSKYLNSK